MFKKKKKTKDYIDRKKKRIKPPKNRIVSTIYKSMYVRKLQNI